MKTYQGRGRAAALGRGAMVATSHTLAAQVALQALRQGGNAADAAVAGALVLGLCEPMMCGLGGDVFAMVRDPVTGVIHGLNGSGRAPAALGAGRLRAAGMTAIPLDSPHSVTVPGAVDAFDRLLKSHGRLGLAAAVEPAIYWAEKGVPVGHRTALDWMNYGARLWGAGRRHYLQNDQIYRAGDVFTAPGQAEALRLIARDGVDAFYRGPVMADMLQTLTAAGGLHTADDFAATAAEEVEPLRRFYRELELVELPPNGQGATALLLAGILERFNLSHLDPVGTDRIHLHAEATRLAYLARNRFIGDPATGQVDVERMLSDAVVDGLAAAINPKRAAETHEPRIEALHRDTVYICVVDENRLAVSLIYSTFWPFGSGLASDTYGISLQNRGAGFSLQQGHVNELRGGRRPLHTLIPGFLDRPGLWAMPFGVMGGQYQAAGHAHITSNMVDFGMDPQQAIDCPRSFADVATGMLDLEPGVPDQVALELAERGHNIRRLPIGMGGGQAIRFTHATGLLEGGSDQRKDGAALGW